MLVPLNNQQSFSVTPLQNDRWSRRTDLFCLSDRVMARVDARKPASLCCCHGISDHAVRFYDPKTGEYKGKSINDKAIIALDIYDEWIVIGTDSCEIKYGLTYKGFGFMTLANFANEPVKQVAITASKIAALLKNGTFTIWDRNTKTELQSTTSVKQFEKVGDDFFIQVHYQNMTFGGISYSHWDVAFWGTVDNCPYFVLHDGNFGVVQKDLTVTGKIDGKIEFVSSSGPYLTFICKRENDQCVYIYDLAAAQTKGPFAPYVGSEQVVAIAISQGIIFMARPSSLTMYTLETGVISNKYFIDWQLSGVEAIGLDKILMRSLRGSTLLVSLTDGSGPLLLHKINRLIK